MWIKSVEDKLGLYIFYVRKEQNQQSSDYHTYNNNILMNTFKKCNPSVLPNKKNTYFKFLNEYTPKVGNDI